MMFLPVLEATGARGSAFEALLLPIMILVMVAFYVFMFRKQSKEQKQREQLVSSVEVGDSVLTSSGFYGVICDVSDEVVIVEFGNNKNCRIPMKKECILEIEKDN